MEAFDFSARAGFQGHPPHDRGGPGSPFLAVSRAIPVHGHIRHPMRAVPDRQAGAGHGGETPGREAACPADDSGSVWRFFPPSRVSR